MVDIILTAAVAELHAPPTAFGIDPSGYVALAMIAVFGIMLWKKVPAMIAAALDKKIVGIKAQLDEAERLRTEAEALKAEYEQKAKVAVADAEAMKTAAAAEARDIVAKAKTKATELIALRGRIAEDRIAAAERNAIADVRAAAAKAATDAAAALLAVKHDAVADKALVDQAIAVVARV